MSAVVVRAENETTTVKWAKDIIRDIDQHQMTHLHFSKLREDKKSIVCNAVANLPLRSFTVLSHKKNMKNHRNLAAEKARVNRTAWFFCWMSRLLLERVTAYCEYRSMNDYQELRKVRIEFSERGGVNIDDIKAYYRYLSQQSELNMLYLDLYQPAWPVVDIDQFFIYPNRMRAGLQLADAVSSSFYHAVERTNEGLVRPQFAKLLHKTVCINPKTALRYGFGLKVMPTWIPSRLPPDQADILNHYLDG